MVGTGIGDLLDRWTLGTPTGDSARAVLGWCPIVERTYENERGYSRSSTPCMEGRTQQPPESPNCLDLRSTRTTVFLPLIASPNLPAKTRPHRHDARRQRLGGLRRTARRRRRMCAFQRWRQSIFRRCTHDQYRVFQSYQRERPRSPRLQADPPPSASSRHATRYSHAARRLRETGLCLRASQDNRALDRPECPWELPRAPERGVVASYLVVERHPQTQQILRMLRELGTRAIYQSMSAIAAGRTTDRNIGVHPERLAGQQYYHHAALPPVCEHSQGRLGSKEP